jgi:PEP-CTERM motif
LGEIEMKFKSTRLIKNLGFVAVIVGLFSYGPAEASAITYSIQTTVGSYSASGTITTDGTIGTLSQANISDFSITLSGDGNPVVLTPSDASVYLYASALSATQSQLLFNFDASLGDFAFTGTPPGGSYSYLDIGIQHGGQGPTDYEAILLSTEQSIPESGQQVIATAVPEPSTWAMMLLGFAGLGFMACRRRGKASSMAAA